MTRVNKRSVMWLMAALCVVLSACESSTFTDVDAVVTKQEKIEQVKQVYQSRGWSIRTDIPKEEFEAYCDTVDLVQLDRELCDLEELFCGECKPASVAQMQLMGLDNKKNQTVTLVGVSSTSIGEVAGVIILDAFETGGYGLNKAYVVLNQAKKPGWENGSSHYKEDTFAYKYTDDSKRKVEVMATVIYTAYMGSQGFTLRGTFEVGHVSGWLEF